MTFSIKSLDLDIQGVESKLHLPEFDPPSQKWGGVLSKRPAYKYEAVMVALLRKILESTDTPVFADIGSFAGYYTIYAAKVIETLKAGEVFAFESNRQYVNNLEKNIEANQVNAKVFHSALSDKNDENLKVLGASVSCVPNAEGEDVKSVTLDSLCQKHDLRLNIAKMDVNGFEGKILGGMANTLKHDLKYLLLELHPNVYLEKYAPGITRMQILDKLEAAGFTNYYIAGHRYSWSDGMRKFYESGQFAYQPLTRENRGMLLFDRHNHIFVLSSKKPLEDLIGPSVLDPSLE